MRKSQQHINKRSNVQYVLDVEPLMWIARIEPAEPGHDRRTFECPECDHTITEVVKCK